MNEQLLMNIIDQISSDIYSCLAIGLFLFLSTRRSRRSTDCLSIASPHSLNSFRRTANTMYVPMSPPPIMTTKTNNNSATLLQVGENSTSNSILDRYSAAAKRYKYLRRLLKFRQMDFEFAIWQVIHLFIAPQKVFRAFQYRKRMMGHDGRLSTRSHLFT